MELEFDFLPKVRKLDILARKNVLSKNLEGNWTAMYKGRGMEFAGYRSYTYSDDASQIDWKASLKSKDVLVKEYEEERMLNVMILIDVSDSMLFSSNKKLKAEYAAEMAATLSNAILRSGDAVGIGMFTDRIVAKVFPNLGRSVYTNIIKELSNNNNYGGNFDISVAIKFTLSMLKDKGLIIIISDFLGLKDNWYRNLNIASQKYEIIGMMVRDRIDKELPKNTGEFIVEDPFTKEKMVLDVNQYREYYQDYVKKEEEEIERKFRINKSTLFTITTDQDYSKSLVNFFKKRAKIYSRS